MKTAKKSPPDTATPLPNEYIAFLDGLRAVAALWVLFGHARLLTIGWQVQHGILGVFTNPALYLHFAVVIFIVLSGYCLMLPVLRNGELPGGVPSFFKKRARRILPPYYAAMAFCLLLNCLVPYTQWVGLQPAYPGVRFPLRVWLTNGLLMQDVFPAYNTINGVFWSIAVEWHIYVWFPLLILLWRRAGIFIALIAAIVGAHGLTFVNDRLHPILGSYFVLLFGMGMTAAVLARRPPRWTRSIAPLLLVCSGAYLARKLWWYPIYDLPSALTHYAHGFLLDTLVGTLTATGLFLLATRGDNVLVRSVRNTLSWRPLVFIGGFSYSLYLFHFPLLTIIRHYTTEGALISWTPTRKYLLLVTVGAVVILAACYGLYLLFERPFLTRKPATDAKQAAAQADAGTVSIAGR